MAAANSLHDSAVVEANWPIIANTEVLNVSQQYAGHPGYLVSECSNGLPPRSRLTQTPLLPTENSTDYFEAELARGAAGRLSGNASLPSYQVWAKPQPGGALAVLVVNVCDESHCAEPQLTTTLTLDELYHRELFAQGAPKSVAVRDLWRHEEVSAHATELRAVDIPPHGGLMVLLTPNA